MSEREGLRELFVWYRVEDARADPARTAVAAMRRSLESACPGLQMRLLIRRGDGVQTWMETYARPARAPDEPGGVDAATEAAIAAAALSLRGFIDGERHAEAFAVALAQPS